MERGDHRREPVAFRKDSKQRLKFLEIGGKQSAIRNLPVRPSTNGDSVLEEDTEKLKNARSFWAIKQKTKEDEMRWYSKVKRNYFSELINKSQVKNVEWPVGPERRQLPSGEARKFPEDIELATAIQQYTAQGTLKALSKLKSDKARRIFLQKILINTSRNSKSTRRMNATNLNQRNVSFNMNLRLRVEEEMEKYSQLPDDQFEEIQEEEGEETTEESLSSSSEEEQLPLTEVHDEIQKEGTTTDKEPNVERALSDESVISREFVVEEVGEGKEATPEVVSFGSEDDVCTCEQPGHQHDHFFFTGHQDLQHSTIYLTDDEDLLENEEQTDRGADTFLQWVFAGKFVFPASSFLPKMLYPEVAPEGKLPRLTMLQKRKSEYSMLSLEEILHQMLCIDPFHLVPPRYVEIPDSKKYGLFISTHFIPIEYFDDDYFDVWTNEKWMETSVGSDGFDYPVPAIAFIPASITYREFSDEESFKYTLHEWTYVAVYDYDPKKQLFSVVPVALDRGPYHIHRIYICFKSENPITAATRIYQALVARDEAELILRYEDLKEFTKKMNIRRPSTQEWANILRLSTRNGKLEKYPKVFRSFRLFYEQTMVDLLLKKIITCFPVYSFIDIPVKKVWQPKLEDIITGTNADEVNVNRIGCLRETIYALGGIYQTMNGIYNKCLDIIDMSLFGIEECYELNVAAFNVIQGTVVNQMQLFIKEAWSNYVIGALLSCLEKQGLGYYNIKEDNYLFYEHSKVFRIMWLVKFYMEYGLRNLLKGSIDRYVAMFEIQSCDGILHLADDFVWGNDLVNSPYIPKKRPIFKIFLSLDENGGHYCTDLKLFKEAILRAYDKVIDMTHKVPQVDRHINKKLKYPPVMFLLNCVSLLGGEIERGREDLNRIMDKAIIPVKAYLAEYARFIDLYCLNVDEYVEQFKEENHLASEVTSEIETQIHLRMDLDASLPTSIAIGMFTIETGAVKELLMNKRADIRNKLLNAHAARMKLAMQEAMVDYMNIYRKLCEKPVSIENIIELKEWMETVPLAVKGYEDAIHTRLLDYEVLDYFYYSLSNADFGVKWDAITWPYKIQCKLEETDIFLMEETERFLKLQQIDEGALQDRIDYLSSIITNLSGQDDVAKVHPIAVEVRLAWKGVKEAQEFGILLNQRQKLFNIPVTPFDEIPKLIKEFEPYKNLWGTASDWCKSYDFYMDNPLCTVDNALIETTVTDYYKTMAKCIRIFKDIPACQKIAMDMKQNIEEFRPLIPIIQAINHPGMKERHWAQFREKTGINIILTPYLTFKQCLDVGVREHFEVLKEIVDLAGKEFVLEQALTKMQSEWEGANMSVTPYKATGTYIMKVTDEQLQMLDDHIALTQQLTFSPFKGAFEQDIEDWNVKIRMASEVLDAWFECQKSWMYLEPILTSEDIARQLPVESKRFSTVQRSWRRIMNAAYENPGILDYCSNKKLLDQFGQNNRILDQVQRGLTEYLEQKRLNFPRLFFLSDDELLEILSQSKFPWAVQPHLKKCFENIYQLDFIDGTHITVMYSGEGECVKLIPDMYATGSVEVWLSKVEEIMRNTIRETISQALKVIEEMPKTQWVLDWPGQVVIAGSQTYWTAHVERGIREHGLKQYFNTMLKQLDGLRGLLKSKLTRVEREVMSALIVIEVHARDVLMNLVELKVNNVNEFDWISQLRYYWVVDELKVRAVNAEFNYGYEYLGNSGRLVITPLTDRCYLTLTGALHLKFGGAPAGPAGTGKTETTKDLAKAFAIQCVVFNCSDQLDFKAMGKFFKGLASSGAWACFDEFNRIDIEVLSVIAQQITTIQKAQMTRVEKFMFEGTELTLKAACAVFITMNPGYAGRTELPDNLKALFRPVAMMVPDYTLIAEISLFSYGFSDAKLMAGKITTTFKLSSEQLSSQDHYDFGMRAVKTVIAAAGNLKRENPDMDEKQIVLRALKDVNVPKFLRDDLKLFNGIVSDLFPRMQEQHVDYGQLELSIRLVCNDFGLEDVDEYVMKVIQLYETTVVRHGLMLVGPTGSGKSKCYQILKQAMTNLKGEMSPSGSPFEAVFTFVLNPKSITMGQLYGEFDLLTHEWTDGILPSMVRIGASAEDMSKRWYIFDGPVDAVWIENMNTVLDDNKKLCLTSGEIIKLTSSMTLMFEVADLAVASPATVSRCGMVYIEPSVLGLSPFINCWIRRLPKLAKMMADSFHELISRYLLPGVVLLRSQLKEIVTSVDSAIVLSFLKLLDSFLVPLTMKDSRPPPSAKFLKLLPQLLPVWVIFSLVWSVGATCDSPSQAIFSNWLTGVMTAHSEEPKFPENSLVYDYRFHDGGFTMATPSGEPEPPEWVHWMNGVPEYKISIDTKYSDIEVPTINSVRNSELLGMLLINESNVLCVGPTGTGKTVTILNKLSRNMPKKFVSDFLNFSARTSANQTQDLIDSKLDKRRRGVYGPPVLKRMALFIDDFNMPALEVYGAQPPIELIRQWMDFGGWYDRRSIGDFRTIVDLNFVAAMGPPGGGRNPVTARLLRHFHYLAFTELDDECKKIIFSTILSSWLLHTNLEEKYIDYTLNASLNVYSTVIKELLPTPAKTHYTFNLRDLSKVFQGILMALPEDVPTHVEYFHLWFHENCRVFEDRMVNDKDRMWFQALLHHQMVEGFHADSKEVLTKEPILFADFIQPDYRHYSMVMDMFTMTEVLQNYLGEYNGSSTAPMNLVLFYDAMSHISRICRIIRQPQGNGLLLGMGGSGRQSLTRLATHINEMTCFQIVLNKSFGINEWKDSVKDLMLKAGVYNKETVFLFSDTQIKYESFLEDLNNMLNSGDVPNIYQAEDLDLIYQAMRVPVTDVGLDPTKSNLFQFYLKEVRTNLHSVVTMSPIGEIFRARLRQFPALVNCCTIDWFSPWPDAALQSVAQQFLEGRSYIGVSDDALRGIVNCCMRMHQSVIQASDQFLQELSRHNYVTPTSYLQLLYSYLDMMERTKTIQVNAISRLQGGLDKLQQTAKDVEVMQAELEAMQPELIAAQEAASIMVEKIEADKVVAEATKEQVEEEERAAAKMAAETQAIADDAASDLEQVLPMLRAAENSLKALNKGDISEVRSLKRPPEGVVLVLEAICIMKNIKPAKITLPDGKRVMDYWEPGRNMLADPGAFLNSLMNFNKADLTEVLLAKLKPYIDNPNFRPAKIKTVSKACMSLCQWVHAMVNYYYVNLTVAPKKAALQEAQEKLEVVEIALAKSRARLRVVEEGMQRLLAKLEETVNRKKELEDNSALCVARLDRAFRLINGLSGESVRWKESVATMKVTLGDITGNILVSAGAVAYLSPFTEAYRNRLLLEWVHALDEYNIAHTQECRPVDILGDPVQVRLWQLQGLPKDSLSIENAILVSNSTRGWTPSLVTDWARFAVTNDFMVTIFLQVFSRGELKGTTRATNLTQLVTNDGVHPLKPVSKFQQHAGEDGNGWPLFIDPQGQANRWIKNMSRERNLKVMKPTDRDLMREMERALTFGWTVLIENLGTTIDQAMDPILNRQTFVQNGELYMKLGDSVIPYNNEFKLYLTTKLPNPHYMPEVSVKVLVVNFALVPSGLQDQLLAEVVMQERPDLEEARSRIIVSSAQMRSELKDIETKILQRLAESQGNPVDDIDLINTLEESKSMSEEIRSKVEISAETQNQIDAIRLTYIPVAERAQILFFCVADLARVDPMYQYSLEWFTRIFIDSMVETEKSSDVPARIRIINNFFTFELYCRVCRSLFERNKLQFAFLLCIRILLNMGDIDPGDWTFFLAGGSPLREMPNPVKWLTNRSWTEILSLENLAVFKPFVESFIENYPSYKHIIDSTEPHREALPKPWMEKFDAFHKMMIVKCLRPDKVTNSMQDFLSDHLGQQFIEPQTSDLGAMYKDSSVASPLVFILSPGTDPAAELYKFADKLKMTKRLSSISLGQGQGPFAEAMFLEAKETGGWVFFQNCHLAPSWMPRLEYLVENVVPESAHKAFRVWLTSTPSPCFPVSILQNGSKMTIEPPRGVKANLLKSYTRQVPEFTEFLESENEKVQPFKWLLFSLCLFHGVCIERRKFGPLGFNIPYEFTDGDLRICVSQLNMFLLEYDEVPFKVLSFTAGQINYGGRVTDDWDRRCLMNLLADYYKPQVLSEDHMFDENNVYRQLVKQASLLDYLDYIKLLPMNDAPGLFGLHDNADISCAQAETYNTLSILLSLLSKQVSGQAASPEEVTTNMAHYIMGQLPRPFPNLDRLQKNYPVTYGESLNTVLIQEVVRFNKLLAAIHSSLEELVKALKGLVVMSESLEKMSDALFTNKVPGMWAAKAYPSLKPLGAWVSDLQLRIDFIKGWIDGGIPPSFWISGFYFPQAFLTACQQNFARKYVVSIDSLSYKFVILKEKPNKRPDDGCVVYGLFLEGARWDSAIMLLAESLPKQLYTSMAPIWMVPEQRHKKLAFGSYDCPVYKTLLRAGTLSTTGHSTNYVLTVEVPTNREQAHWIKRGVALFCALDY